MEVLVSYWRISSQIWKIWLSTYSFGLILGTIWHNIAKWVLFLPMYPYGPIFGIVVWNWIPRKFRMAHVEFWSNIHLSRVKNRAHISMSAVGASAPMHFCSMGASTNTFGKISTFIKAMIRNQGLATFYIIKRHPMVSKFPRRPWIMFCFVSYANSPMRQPCNKWRILTMLIQQLKLGQKKP